MSIATEITRISTLRNRIRQKLVTLGLVSSSSDLEDCADAIETITANTSSDLSVSGATVTAPAGYYANAASTSVSTVTHANPTVTVNSSTGLITASHTQSAGYVSAGTTTGTSQLTVYDGSITVE